jgi:hypothetical protein
VENFTEQQLVVFMSKLMLYPPSIPVVYPLTVVFPPTLPVGEKFTVQQLVVYPPMLPLPVVENLTQQQLVVHMSTLMVFPPSLPVV